MIVYATLVINLIQATSNYITYLPIQDYGWKITNANTLTIDWDSEQNISHVKRRVDFLQKGCSCKTGCSTGRCRCKKANNYCGPGCKCVRCTNLKNQAISSRQTDDETESVDSDSSDEENIHLESEVDHLMLNSFGEYEMDTLDTDTMDDSNL